MSPAAAPLPELPSEQGVARVAQAAALEPVPVGETYQVAANSEGASATTAKADEQKINGCLMATLDVRQSGDTSSPDKHARPPLP